MDKIKIYRIKTLGKGGFGKVDLYQATNGQQFAVKKMINQWDNNHYEMFKNEISIMKNLDHKNIVKVINYSIRNNNPLYIMKYFKDGSLRNSLDSLKSKGRIYPLKGASGIIYYLADALSYAHKRGIIHRDLKPENILFDGQEPKIADWGIGKFIHKGSKVFRRFGTKPYCAPEQWDSGISDQCSDIYSLGIIYRELITVPLINQVRDSRVNAIINKMTMKCPNDRYQSMDMVKKDIIALDIISINDPMSDFWDGTVKAGAVIVFAYLLYNIFAYFGDKY
jgi:serine/threonine protein kinase